MQDAIDEIADDMVTMSSVIDTIYPVGSIYMSMTDSTVADVVARFGGQWERFAQGKTLIGVDPDDTDFSSSGNTGGSKTNPYTPAGSNSAVTLTAAQSGVPAHSHGLNNHTHEIGKHSHGFTQPAYSVSGGAHSHTVGTRSSAYGQAWAANGAKGVAAGSDFTAVGRGGDGSWFSETASVTPSSYTVTRTTNGAVQEKAAYTSGQASGSTSNNTAKDATASHNHTFTGTATNISTLQPYITIYMYRRIS